MLFVFVVRCVTSSLFMCPVYVSCYDASVRAFSSINIRWCHSLYCSMRLRVLPMVRVVDCVFILCLVLCVVSVLRCLSPISVALFGCALACVYFVSNMLIMCGLGVCCLCVLRMTVFFSMYVALLSSFVILMVVCISLIMFLN